MIFITFENKIIAGCFCKFFNNSYLLKKRKNETTQGDYGSPIPTINHYYLI